MLRSIYRPVEHVEYGVRIYMDSDELDPMTEAQAAGTATITKTMTIVNRYFPPLKPREAVKLFL